MDGQDELEITESLPLNIAQASALYLILYDASVNYKRSMELMNKALQTAVLQNNQVEAVQLREKITIIGQLLEQIPSIQVELKEVVTILTPTEEEQKSESGIIITPPSWKRS